MKTPSAYALVMLALLAAVWAGSGCDNGDDPNPPAAVTLELLEAPTALAANMDTVYLYRARVENGTVDSVHCAVFQIQGSAGPESAIFSLFDDGGQQALWGPAFAGTTSRDVTANNGVYTRGINARQMTDGASGTYSFTFIAMRGGQSLATQTVMVTVAEVQACVIDSVPVVNSLSECFDPQTLQLEVARSAADEVDSVRVELVRLADEQVFGRTRLAATAGDTVWQTELTPNFFRCAPMAEMPPASFALRYTAYTMFGVSCSRTDNGVLFMNQAPVLSELVMADTLYRPTVDSIANLSLVTVRLTDCEFEGDTSFTGVRFQSHRDDTSSWNPWHELNVLRDHGRNGDAVAGDGIYSVYLAITRSPDFLDNMYYFRFYAVEGFVDRGCEMPFDTSAFIYDSVRVIQPPAAMGGGLAVARDAGMGAVLR